MVKWGVPEKILQNAVQTKFGLVFVLILVLTQVLSLNEFLELIVPICYLFCYLIAFYGPNAFLIGWKVVHS